MKAILVLGLLLSQVAFAQAEKECAKETLKCELIKQLPTGGQEQITSSISQYDGINSDEPSEEPYQCMMSAYLKGENGLTFVVEFGDVDLEADVYTINSDYQLSGADAAFTVVKNKPFYFRAQNETLKCVLN